MILVEETPVPEGALPVQALRDHLRLGTGFGEDSLQDAVLEQSLRAAIAAVEGRTEKALIARRFRWTLHAWRDLGRQVLPMAPVNAITGFGIVDRNGVETAVPAEAFRLEPDTHRPALVAGGLVLPPIPVGGHALIAFDAGYGADWAEVPDDLKQAVLLLAGQYYEHRHDPTEMGGLPAAVAALIARYRNLRFFGRLS